MSSTEPVPSRGVDQRKPETCETGGKMPEKWTKGDRQKKPTWEEVRAQGMPK